MSLIERLRDLEARLRERNEDSVPIYAMAEAWCALPKLLAVVEAAKALRNNLGPRAHQENAAQAEAFDDALAALEEP